MEIVLVVPAFVPALDYGGPITKVTALANAFLDQGHGVQIWCANYGLSRRHVMPGVRSVGGVTVHYFRRLLTYRWSPVVPHAYLAAKRAHVDVAHCFGLRDGMTYFAALGFAAQHVPYVVEPTGMTSPRFRNVALKRVFDTSVGDRHLRRAAALVASSTEEATALQGRASKVPISIRRNPLPPPAPVEPDRTVRERIGATSEDLIVAWVGRISRTKGLDLLIEAVIRTARVHVILVGPDDRDGTLSSLEGRMNRPEAAHRFHRLGPRWGTERDRLIVSCDAFVLPSRMESFGYSAAEAAVLGVPVIVTEPCGVASLIQSLGAGLVAPATVPGIAAALAELRDNPRMRAKLRASAPRVRHALDPHTVAAEQLEIYRRAVEHARQ